jgi:hypothetical protein
MQTTRKAVRYYIDHEADTPVIRSVPVSRPVQALAHTVEGTGSPTTNGSSTAETAAEHLASQTRRGAARHRLASLVQSSVRRRQRGRD